MQIILSLHLDLNPLSLLLGLPDSKVTSLANRRLFDVMTFSAWKNIILQWISDKAPSVQGWQKVLMELLPLQYLTCIIHSKTDLFYKVREPFVNYLDSGIANIMSFGFHG